MADLTVDELKEKLRNKGIYFPSTARKAELFELYEDNKYKRNSRYSNGKEVIISGDHLTVDELKDILRDEGIYFSSTARKPELVALYEDNITSTSNSWDKYLKRIHKERLQKERAEPNISINEKMRRFQQEEWIFQQMGEEEKRLREENMRKQISNT